MFIPISGILCTYFPMNSPERGHFLAMGENNDTNCLYFFQMDGYRRNNDTYCSYFSLGWLSGPRIPTGCLAHA
ncbi:hypothetical protein DJ90_4684 [Paenibacillus macerans]|uniref:Uncharacterized protein n=1 Tax=Paenibacillus macerans TaxID=44252 RepID=A0A090YQ54_PAEMA|nr:hypothetical protein DJ90_4684 [Paenibacillus macerans]